MNIADNKMAEYQEKKKEFLQERKDLLNALLENDTKLLSIFEELILNIDSNKEELDKISNLPFTKHVNNLNSSLTEAYHTAVVASQKDYKTKNYKAEELDSKEADFLDTLNRLPWNSTPCITNRDLKSHIKELLKYRKKMSINDLIKLLNISFPEINKLKDKKRKIYSIAHNDKNIKYHNGQFWYSE